MSDADAARAEPAGVSVVLPALDEEGAIGATLDALEAALRPGDRPYEIIVVDDGSRDGTAGILASRGGVRVIRHPEPRGYGASLKTGIRAARHSLVVVMDADGTYPPGDVPRLADACGTADMVVGARTGANVHASPLRSGVKWIFRRYAQWLVGAPIPDLNSGLRAFDRRTADRFADVLPDGFSFTTTITVGSMLEGLRVRFVSIDYLPRIGRSKIRPVRDTLRIARQLVRLGILFAPLRTSLALAAPLVLALAASWAAHAAARATPTPADLGCLAGVSLIVAAGGLAEQRVRRRRGSADVLASREA